MTRYTALSQTRTGSASRRLQRKTCPRERSLPYDACQRSSAGQEKHRSEEEDRFESRKGPASAHVDNSGSSPPSETDIHGFLSIYDSKPFFKHLWITREAASVGCHAGFARRPSVRQAVAADALSEAIAGCRGAVCELPQPAGSRCPKLAIVVPSACSHSKRGDRPGPPISTIEA